MHGFQAFADANEEVAIRRYARSMHEWRPVHRIAVACDGCGSTHNVEVRAGMQRVAFVCPLCWRRNTAWVEVPDAS